MRASLTAGDYRLALALLAPDDEERRRLEARTETDGPDVLWDDPRLVERLLAYRGLEAPSAALFLYTVMRRLLVDAGVADRAVADYCAALLLVFGRGDRALRVSEHDDDRTAYLVDLMIAAGRAEGERRFRVQMHIGDFALWMTGIFPDYIAARRARKGGPGLDYYERAGRAAFLEASDHTLAGRYGLGDVLRQAGERFAQLRVAMNRMSDRMLFPQHAGPDRLLRQVADEFRLRDLQ